MVRIRKALRFRAGARGQSEIFQESLEIVQFVRVKSDIYCYYLFFMLLDKSRTASSATVRQYLYCSQRKKKETHSNQKCH